MRDVTNTIQLIDALSGLRKLPDACIDCIITSPPYYQQRDYGAKGQIGLEDNYHAFVENLHKIFEESHRVLKDTGSCYIVIDDTYSDGSRFSSPINKKSKMLIPERLAIKMVDSGWLLRNTVIWEKTNAKPEAVKDRFTHNYENVYFFTKSDQYYFHQIKEAVAESTLSRYRRGSKRKDKDVGYPDGGKSNHLNKFLRKMNQSPSYWRNKREVWEIAIVPFKSVHTATFPTSLVEVMINASCPPNGIVLDPFMGSGTTAVVAKKLKRKFLGFEVNPDYIKIANGRLR